MASFMLPLLVPEGRSPDVLLRVIVGITLFAAAYLAEIMRGGLQAVPEGQREAAASLGLGYWKTQVTIVLPQALSIGLPSIMNSIISLFKNTSLVAIVSLYDLTGAFSLAMNSQPSWRPFKLEAYLFIAGIYFMFCFSMSRYSLGIEKRLASSKTPQNSKA
jgi:general L-amino acid transport system permease protein